MHLRKARELATSGRYCRAIEEIQACAIDSYPRSLLIAAAGIARHALGQIQNKNTRVVFSHNLNREGAPLALYSLLEDSSVADDTVVVTHSPGVLAGNFCSLSGVRLETDSILFYDNNILPTEAASKSLVIAIWLCKLKPSSVFINTSRGWLVARACSYLGISYEWWIHEAEPAFSFLVDRGTYDLAVCQLSEQGLLHFASERILKEHQALISSSNSAVSCLRPIYIRKDLRTTKKAYTKRGARMTLSITKDAIVILNVGTYCARKNQAELAEALLSIEDQASTKVELIFLGSGDADGEYASNLANLVFKINTNCKLVSAHLIAPSSSVGIYYAASDLYVHSSRSEVHCQAIMEARFFQLPIVYKNGNGVAEAAAGYDRAASYSMFSELRVLLAQSMKLFASPLA